MRRKKKKKKKKIKERFFMGLSSFICNTKKGTQEGPSWRFKIQNYEFLILQPFLFGRSVSLMLLF